MSIVAVLIAAVVGLIGLFLNQKRRADDATALNDNNEVKNALNEIDKIISKNDGQEASEQEKRAQLEKDAEEKKNADKSQDELLDFINRDDKSK